ncbi:hypothetical protein FQR29_18060 [Salmonella enterica]|nr:hypothetical protein [Salmonella enterica]
MDAKIRAEINPVRTGAASWSEQSAMLFTGEKSAEHRNAYRLLNDALAADLILTDRDNITKQSDNSWLIDDTTIGG